MMTEHKESNKIKDKEKPFILIIFNVFTPEIITA